MEQNGLGDFILRTRRNLEKIERADEPDSDKYEVTQLINSLLGIVVFSKEDPKIDVPPVGPEQLLADGWPHGLVRSADGREHNLQEIVGFMRHAVAHYRIQLEPEENMIAGIRMYNDPPGKDAPRWSVTLKISELRLAVDKIAIEMLRLIDPKLLLNP